MSKTQDVASGARTKRQHAVYSALDIANKDPNFDYSFRLRKEIEEGGGVDIYGFEPINEGNTSGEAWQGPIKALQKRGKSSIVYQDTILCRRPKEVAEYFQSVNNTRYNNQISFVKSIAPEANVKLRNMNSDSGVTMDVKGKNDFTQKTGPTMGQGE